MKQKSNVYQAYVSLALSVDHGLGKLLGDLALRRTTHDAHLGHLITGAVHEVAARRRDTHRARPVAQLFYLRQLHVVQVHLQSAHGVCEVVDLLVDSAGEITQDQIEVGQLVIDALESLPQDNS